MTLDVQESIFIGDGGARENPNLLFLLMTDKPGLCDRMRSGKTIEDMTYFMVSPRVLSHGQFWQPWPGGYPVIPQIDTGLIYAHASLSRTGSTCQLMEREEGTSGLITLEGYEPKPGGFMIGTFDVAFGTAAGEGTGDFNALYCDFWDPWYHWSLDSGCQ